MALTNLSLRGSGLKAYFYLGTLLLSQKKIPKAVQVYKDAVGSAMSPKTNWSRDVCPERDFIVSHEHQFVYCPIPKVACSSLKRVMVELFDPENAEDVLKLPNDLFHSYVYHNLTLFSHYREEESSSFLKNTKYFKFAFVRNPWSRLVSAYLNKFVEAPSIKKRTLVPDNAREVISAVYQTKKLQADFQTMITFREFVQYVLETPDELLDGHWKPQYLFLGDYEFDFIGRLENLSTDFETLKEKLNLSISVPWSNKSSSKRINDGTQESKCLADAYPSEIRALGLPARFKQFYTPDLVELVNERYLEDIERFGYKY